MCTSLTVPSLCAAPTEREREKERERELKKRKSDRARTSVPESEERGDGLNASDPLTAASLSVPPHAQQRSATMTNATLFCGNLEPTRMRWKSEARSVGFMDLRSVVGDRGRGLVLTPGGPKGEPRGCSASREDIDRICS